MNKSILLLATLMLTTVTHAQWWGNEKVKGNGKMTTETRTTEDYDGIKCAGGLERQKAFRATNNHILRARDRSGRRIAAGHLPLANAGKCW